MKGLSQHPGYQWDGYPITTLILRPIVLYQKDLKVILLAKMKSSMLATVPFFLNSATASQKQWLFHGEMESIVSQCSASVVLLVISRKQTAQQARVKSATGA